LGSTSLIVDASGTLLSSLKYTPFGELRSGTASTDYLYTGQRQEAEIGLYFYVSRFFDPGAGNLYGTIAGWSPINSTIRGGSLQSKAKDVNQYLQEVPVDRLEALTRLRALCLATLQGYTENMEYGGPCYAKNGTIEVSFMSQKNHISLYILKEAVLDQYRDVLQGVGVSLGKGCIRYSKPGRINFEIVEELLDATLRSDAEIC
jgi:uncharacterized protein YdhG (YjbR/CyaY superfamily)